MEEFVMDMQAEISKYTRNLAPASRAILLSGPAELYQQMLAKALAHYFEAKILLLDPTNFLIKLHGKYGTGGNNQPVKRSISETTLERMSGLLQSFTMAPQREQSRALGVTDYPCVVGTCTRRKIPKIISIYCNPDCLKLEPTDFRGLQLVSHMWSEFAVVMRSAVAKIQEDAVAGGKGKKMPTDMEQVMTTLVDLYHKKAEPPILVSRFPTKWPHGDASAFQPLFGFIQASEKLGIAARIVATNPLCVLYSMG